MREYNGAVKKMPPARGGGLEHYGAIGRAGLTRHMSSIEFGCGGGRLALTLGKGAIRIDHSDVDARRKASAHFRFALQAEAAPAQDVPPPGRPAMIPGCA